MFQFLTFISDLNLGEVCALVQCSVFVMKFEWIDWIVSGGRDWPWDAYNKHFDDFELKQLKGSQNVFCPKPTQRFVSKEAANLTHLELGEFMLLSSTYLGK